METAFYSSINKAKVFPLIPLLITLQIQTQPALLNTFQYKMCY